MTQLDAMGPFEVLANLPDAEVLLVAKRARPVTAGFGARISPHTDLRRCPKLDVLCVAGGPGIDALLLDRRVLDFIRRQARTARYVTSVCTGSLVLCAAGLLRGRRAACHWLSLPLLKAFGAKPTARRVERDGKFITAGGVTSGIDFGLVLAARLRGAAAAKAIQLKLQYDPQPPFKAGTPAQAGPRLAARIAEAMRDSQARRAALVRRSAAALRAG